MNTFQQSRLIVSLLIILGVINAVYLLDTKNFLVKAISAPISSPISGPIVPVTVVSQTSATFDDVNEINGRLDNTYKPNHSSNWLGNGGQNQDSWTGLRFTNINVPVGATIKSAKLEVYSAKSQWTTVKINIAAEATGSAETFSSTSVPSRRMLTTQRIYQATNNQWNAGQWYLVGELKNPIQEVVSRADWQSGNSLAIIAHGVGPAWGRKFVTSFDGSPALAPKLTITYQR